ncbi:uncharacterized protein B0I36DRAFT_256336 [Microdochium trichocladiopsis]|uniref:Azaphilone pigments biosynthesis cluster protein L N-terminal domain-containing protein n=1 Tax=Microdochium trichocladiopsis TaxID=1682393 RepID=A0A9P8XUA8_9PEZI|nr:uncharacterized protein B0I36DRAFT_256336 [Microdochium trichocladiopsis]KAH7012575.1 hypothetical protein B0I36DRAFT_256336 [Microdochium trichocladiopsis]
MDGVSAAASVVGVLTAALQSAQALSKMIDDIKGVPSEIAAIHRDLEAVTSVLHRLEPYLRDGDGSSQDGPAMSSMPDIALAVNNCRTSCDQFQALLKRWLRHSTEDKMFWVDRWRIGLFGQSRTKAFQARLFGYKGTLALALQTDTVMRTIRQGFVMEDRKKTMLQTLEQEVGNEIARVTEEGRDIDARCREVSLYQEAQPKTDEELEKLRQDAQGEFQLLREANQQLQKVCEEALRKVVSARTGQNIKGVRATNESAVLTGYINTEELGQTHRVSVVCSPDIPIEVAPSANQQLNTAVPPTTDRSMYSIPPHASPGVSRRPRPRCPEGPWPRAARTPDSLRRPVRPLHPETAHRRAPPHQLLHPRLYLPRRGRHDRPPPAVDAMASRPPRPRRRRPVHPGPAAP